jgi:hypothetical protein
MNKPIGSVEIAENTRLTALKPCRCCNLVWFSLPSEGILYKGLLYFNCQCGSTLTMKDKTYGPVQPKYANNQEEL